MRLPNVAPAVPEHTVHPPRFWWLVGLSFLLAVLLGLALVALVERTRAQQAREQAAEIANLHAREIGDRLEHALSASFALAAVIRQGDGRIDRFEHLAAEMLRTYGGIGALQYAPGGVIEKIVPLAGNERALGFNPLLDPKQSFEARKAVETKRLVLTGPFELVQGGFGVVGRYPVFLGQNDDQFWGLIQVVVRIDALLATTRIGSLEAAGYRYELSRIEPLHGQRQVFARSGDAVLGYFVEARIRVPGGQWSLRVSAGSQQHRVAYWLAEGLGVLLFGALAALAMAALQREPLRLRREIAIRHAAERELRQSAARLQEIIDTMDAGLLLWDREQRLLAWNGAFERLFPGMAPKLRFGLPRSQLLADLQATELLQPDETDRAFNWDGLGSWDRRLADGRIIATQRLATAEGGRLVLHTDVTEVRRASELLARNERLASLGKLVAGVAHEVNTPIGNALMVVSSVQQRTLAIEQDVQAGRLRRSDFEAFIHSVRESDAIALRNLHRAAELVQHFKQVAVDQVSDQRRHFDLATVLEEILSTLSVRLRLSTHRLETDLAPDVSMDSYPGALGQIVVNLIENSLLHAFPDRQGGLMQLSSRRLPDGRVELRYIDNGVGIPPADLPRIFDPFFTTKLGSGGSGLGLSIALNLVQDLLGGELEVDSPAGAGTSFCLRLPLVAPQRNQLTT